MSFSSKNCAALLLIATLTFTACKKKPVPSSLLDGGPSGESSTLAPLTAPGEAVNKFGFAARMPADTEAYIGSLNLPKHAAALKDSKWAKEVDAFIADKTPVPSANSSDLPTATATLTQLWGKDFFIALGKGSASALKPWSDLMSLNTELQYLTMMKGSMGGTAAGDDAKSAPYRILGQLLGDESLLQRASDLLSKITLPPLMLGVQTDKPDEVLKELVPDALLAQIKLKAKVSQMTAGSGSFTIIEGTVSSFFTDEMKKEIVDDLPNKLPKDRPGLQSVVTQALDAFQKRTFFLAYGKSNGHLIVAIGSERPNLDFATDPAKSLLSRPELAFVMPYAGNNLAAVAFAQADVLQAMQNPEPMQPIARGLIAGLKTSPMFGPMAASLEPRVKDLGALERELQGRKLTTAAGVAWWDKGMHVEMKGGLSTEGLEGKKPLKFGPLMDDPSVLFGVAYHGDPDLTMKARKLFEAWAVMLHGAAQELVKAGLGGKDGPEISKWVEKDIIPNVVTFYDGTKTVFQKGMGNEHAWIIDLGGKVPPLPFFPQKEGEVMKMLRIAGLDTVADRASVGVPWDAMQQSLNKIAASFPMLGGMQLPEATQTNQPGGLTSYSYQIFPGADDLSPTASLSDSTFMMGTSMTQHSELATRLLRGKPATDNSTVRWRINFPGLRDAVKTFSTTGANPTNADSMKATMKWLAPMGESNGRLWIEAGNVRNSITISVKDVQRFD